MMEMTDARSLSNTNLLDFSVCMATHNRADQLRQTLTAYTAVEVGALRWELIVVDNNSTDHTAEVLEQFSTQLPLVRLFEAGIGKSRACNTGIEAARGKVIIFTDDDVLPPSDYLTAYAKAITLWPEDAIFGARIEPSFPSNTPAWLRDPEWHFSSVVYARYRPADAEGYVEIAPFGCSFAVKRDALAEHRFPENVGPRQGAYIMGCETRLLHALRADGLRYVYIPSVCVQHIVRPEQVTSRWLAFRAGNYGRQQAYPIAAKWIAERGSLHKLIRRSYFATLRAALRALVCGLLVSPAVATKLRMHHQLRRGIYLELKRIAKQPSHGKDIAPLRHASEISNIC